MARQRISQATPISMMILADLLGYLISFLPGIFAYSVLFHFEKHFWNIGLWWLGFLLGPWIIVSSLILGVFTIRLFFPKLKEGVYKVSLNKGFLAWSFQFYLNRAISVSGLRLLIFSNNLWRFLYLKAMGAKVSYQMNGSLNISLSDIPMIKVGKGSTLAEGVMISCHIFTGEKLIVKSVKIEENVFIGMNCTVGPGTSIGKGTWIGAENKFASDKIPAHSHFSSGVWATGNPQRLEKAEVRLGTSESIKQ